MNETTEDLSPAELEVYDDLMESLDLVGRAGGVDRRDVVAASRAIVQADRLREEVDALPSLMLGRKVNPLLEQLRLATDQVLGHLVGLRLTPKSRAGVHTTEAMARRVRR